MRLKITGNSTLQTVSKTNKSNDDDTILEYKEKCYNLQSMALEGSRAYVVKTNKYPDPENPREMKTTLGEIHIYSDYSSNTPTIIEMSDNVLGHANGAAYYSGALYVAVSSKGLNETDVLIKATFNSNETAVTATQGYTLYDTVANTTLSDVSVRGIAHYRNDEFIIMMNPRDGIEYQGKENKNFNEMQFKIGKFNDELNRFEFTRTFFAKNNGREITQGISYSSANKKLYIVTCNKQIDNAAGDKVEVFMTQNTVIELDFENSKPSKKTFAGKTYDYYLPSNKIVLDKLSADQKIFEMQACCVDETKRRLVYAVDRKYFESGARVQGEIYMVNNLFTKL